MAASPERLPFRGFSPLAAFSDRPWNRGCPCGIGAFLACAVSHEPLQVEPVFQEFVATSPSRGRARPETQRAVCRVLAHHFLRQVHDVRVVDPPSNSQLTAGRAEHCQVRRADYFAVGHSSECFSFIKDWVEKKVRRRGSVALGRIIFSSARPVAANGTQVAVDRRNLRRFHSCRRK